MEKNVLITIVVPIYNVEKYLDRCVNSLVNQSYKNLQIILVDDGSPDKCPKMCDNWAKKDSRIEVIHKLNSGLGFSRNEGLKKAKGKYVCFVDSDDYIHETTIMELYLKIEESKADVCYYGCVDVIDGVESSKKPPKKLLYIGNEVQKEFAANLIGNMPNDSEPLFSGLSACYAFYNTKFIKDNYIKFHSEREQFISEDMIFNLSVCLFANRIVILPKSLYYYVIRRSDSLRSTYRSDRFEKNKIMYLKLIEYSEKFGLDRNGELRAQKYLLQSTIACIKMDVINYKNRKKTIRLLNRYTEDKIIRKILNNYPISMLPFKQRLFCFFLKYKCNRMLYFLAYLQNKKSKLVI
ncbi:glycosyltransferase family 2 protein [Clostridium perfringens]|nr:glycosyltransferase family 2 protein [Clostridium perfringens]MDK0633330.1 glycosyltransferase family 2 protein [Clostridium perfringens]MDK0983791.1 glycosyltransferase family 2 protein [Clostridium perfringens]